MEAIFERRYSTLVSKCLAQVGSLTAKEHERLERLRRRIAWLERRIALLKKQGVDTT